MEITDEFTLELPPQETYELLLDLERVAPCMPGAALGDARDDGSREVTVTVKLGPMRFSYDGTVCIAEQDDDLRRAVLKGAANEVRGQGSAEAAIVMHVEEAATGSRVATSAAIDLTGRAAQMGHGMVESVTRQIMGQMTRNLSERFAQAPAEPVSSSPGPTAMNGEVAQRSPAASESANQPSEERTLKAGALVWAVLRERIATLFRRRTRSAA